MRARHTRDALPLQWAAPGGLDQGAERPLLLPADKAVVVGGEPGQRQRAERVWHWPNCTSLAPRLKSVKPIARPAADRAAGRAGPAQPRWPAGFDRSGCCPSGWRCQSRRPASRTRPAGQPVKAAQVVAPQRVAAQQAQQVQQVLWRVGRVGAAGQADFAVAKAERQWRELGIFFLATLRKQLARLKPLEQIVQTSARISCFCSVGVMPLARDRPRAPAPPVAAVGRWRRDRRSRCVCGESAPWPAAALHRGYCCAATSRLTRGETWRKWRTWWVWAARKWRGSVQGRELPCHH